MRRAANTRARSTGFGEEDNDIRSAILTRGFDGSAHRSERYDPIDRDEGREFLAREHRPFRPRRSIFSSFSFFSFRTRERPCYRITMLPGFLSYRSPLQLTRFYLVYTRDGEDVYLRPCTLALLLLPRSRRLIKFARPALIIHFDEDGIVINGEHHRIPISVVR